jgi:hypothetical protein
LALVVVVWWATPPADAQVTDCTLQPDGTACDDGNSCDGTDTCSAGGCAGSMIADDGLRIDPLAPGSWTSVISWNLPPGATGSDVLRGTLSALPIGPTDTGETPLAKNLTGSTSFQDTSVPNPGTGYWYLVRGRTSCGGGPWGFQTTNAQATIARQPHEGCVVNVNASPRFLDRGLTITDFTTCLEWEKKSQPGESALHGAYNYYSWDTAKGSWIGSVNAERFAGHSDWRLPSEEGHNDGSSFNELDSIIDDGVRPSIDPIFGPTAAYPTWSSSFFGDYPTYAWIVDFYYGTVNNSYDDDTDAVRAVRGGP